MQYKNITNFYECQHCFPGQAHIFSPEAGIALGILLSRPHRKNPVSITPEDKKRVLWNRFHTSGKETVNYDKKISKK